MVDGRVWVVGQSQCRRLHGRCLLSFLLFLRQFFNNTNGFFHDVGYAAAVAGRCFDERHAQSFLQGVVVEVATVFLKFIIEVQRPHHGNAQALQLKREQQVALQIIDVEHIDDDVDFPLRQFVGHVGLLWAEGFERIGAGKVDDAHEMAANGGPSLNARNRHAGIVARSLVAAA